jgi:protein translocase SecG subunit
MFPTLLAAATAATAKPVTKTLQLTPEQIKALTAQAAQQGNLHPQSWLSLHAGWATHAFAGIFIISAVLLIGLLAVQTTKNEGLSGTIGGRVDANYRGRLGFDGQIARVTGVVATVFVVFATLVSLSGI